MHSPMIYGKDESPQYSVLQYIEKYIISDFILCVTNLLIKFSVESVSGYEVFKLNKYLFGILYPYGVVKWMLNCTLLRLLMCMFCANCILRWIYLRMQNNSICIFISLLLSGINYVFDILEVPRLL